VPVRVAAVVLTWVLLAAPSASAHQQGVSYSDVQVGEGVVVYDLVLSTHDLALDVDGDGTVTSAEARSRLPRLQRIFDAALTVEAGGVACPLTLEDATVVPPESVRFRLRGPCPTELPVHLVVRLGSLTVVDGQNLAKVRVGDLLAEHVFTRTDAEAFFGTASAGVWPTFRRFFLLGIEHIATGYDHILFLLALLLVGGGWRPIVAIVTAFTIAHSVTLSLAVLDVVQLPSRLVESAIALSIAWVALENLLLDRQHGRWRITFAFGLMHGFGFASVLREMHLPRAGVVTSLFAFNLGVEAGQLIVVLASYPIVALIERSPRRRAIVGVASAAILVLALWWFRERAFG
jgi:hydrogenase/urease accessory protein HupE